MSIFSQHCRFFGKQRPHKGRLPARAFTLIELLTVSSIIMIITMLLLLRQSRFDSSTILRSLAYSVALSVRTAQVYGVSVLGSTNTGAVIYAPGYGLYFSSATPTSYILFADFNNNSAYDAGSESVKVYTLSSGYAISEVCATLSNGISRCTGSDDSSGSPTTSSLSIVFKRPNPDATFTTTVVGESYVSAYIQVRSADNTKRAVSVTSAGQTSVQAPILAP